MNQHMFESLEFEKIQQEVMKYALSEEGKQKLEKLQPSFSLNVIKNALAEISEAKKILVRGSSVPVHSLNGMQQLMGRLNKGMILRPEHFTQFVAFLDSLRKMLIFMKDKESLAPSVSSYVYSISDFSHLYEEMNRSIRNGKVDDKASKALSKIRKNILVLEAEMKERIEKVLKSKKYAKFIQEKIVSIRDGHYVIPVRKEYRKNIIGVVYDTSASGSTVFIEPEEVSKCHQELQLLKIDEQLEEEKICSILTNLVEQSEHELNIAIEMMIHYDVLFAKAKYSQEIDGIEVSLNDEKLISLKNARHPLLGKSAVPLNVRMGETYDALVITGPNTGGKTVTIKTVGLLTLMTQCGLHIPVEKGSQLSIFNQILVDIGDGQNIEQSLSTFSSRIKNIIEILTNTNDTTLVLIDELGSGTDPGEGMGLAVAILEELYKKGAIVFATTHYSEIKDFASNHEGFENGSMDFDSDTLKPKYRLIIGKGGDSQAFHIALSLGMHPKLIEKAHLITYKEKKYYESNASGTREWRNQERQLASTKRFKNKTNKKQKRKVVESPQFKIGDNVFIPHLKQYGIVYKPADEVGNVVLMVKGEKKVMNHKRIKMHIEAAELYPENYDFDIIFETKENRKKRNELSRKHVEGLTIEYEE
ncbi:endonuclease MutS2 [Chengkuizengella axinellae]|uniref:Endonuclease MutS2 n=1 Tax=Chengkuizengella axinellae TaxID=3064388 RepID=A0ABT9IUG1_9BACL|nr:endonuclease MutS2 [Chengkuizengella sp. 2205SS18-9]MDP5272993.1 endonuclease MutS2 [Chengkuizengella sp. 2205SS18-9]